MPKKYQGRILSAVVAFLAVLIYGVNAVTLNEDLVFPQQNLPEDIDTYIVYKVIDGDTIKAKNAVEDVTIRLIGINAPETNHPTKPKECFGEEAKTYLTNLLLEKEIMTQKDKSNTDRYNRELRYVFIGEPFSENSSFINEKLVREGYVWANEYKPDIKYQTILDEAEKLAKGENLGLWNVQNCPQ